MPINEHDNQIVDMRCTAMARTTEEHGIFRFESLGVDVRSPQRDESGDKDLIQPVRMSLRIDGRTERFGVTM